MENRAENAPGIANANSLSPPTSNSSSPRASGKNDLLMRLFESEFFDSWIAITYLHKPLSEGIHEYLCTRLMTLPEADVEAYLSQLCQLCFSRPENSLESILVDLCAKSLRIAVKIYWLLLAISQDNPTNTRISHLRDRCEMAALEGHWDLPFKHVDLPPPLPRGKDNPFLRQYVRECSSSPVPINTSHGQRPSSQFSSDAVYITHAMGDAPEDGCNLVSRLDGSSLPEIDGAPDNQGNTASTPLLIHNNAANCAMRDGRAASPSQWQYDGLSPVRSMSPDGLGDGLFSSVFVDTGVEGLIYESTTASAMTSHDATQTMERASMSTVEASGKDEAESKEVDGCGSNKATAPLPQQPPYGSSSGTSNHKIDRGSPSGDASDDGPTHGNPRNAQRAYHQHQESIPVSDTHVSVIKGPLQSQPGGDGHNEAMYLTPTQKNAALTSAWQHPLETGEEEPSSPQRRQTTFGATLDFVEALCMASSNLSALEHITDKQSNRYAAEDRQWALQRALHSINIEMDRASNSGVAIWFPMGRQSQRVVRLSNKESRLLNSREKAPFTLFIEVLNEGISFGDTGDDGEEMDDREGDSATDGDASVSDAWKSALPALPPVVAAPRPQAMGLDGAAAEAAAEGIQWIPHHHRRSSSHDTTSSSVLAAAAMTAVQGSSAAAIGAGGGGGGMGSPAGSHTSIAALVAATTAAIASGTSSLLTGHASAVQLISQRSEGASTFATDPSLGDFNSEGSQSPPHHVMDSHGLSSQHATTSNTTNGNNNAEQPISTTQQQHQKQSNSPKKHRRRSSDGESTTASGRLSREPSLNSMLPPLPRAAVQGGGTWIGAGSIKHHAISSAAGSQISLTQYQSPARPPLPAGAQGLGFNNKQQTILARSASSGDLTSNLSVALAGLRGEAPLVTVRLRIIEEHGVVQPLHGDSSRSTLQHAALGRRDSEVKRSRSNSGDSASPGSSLSGSGGEAELTAARKGAARGAVHPETVLATTCGKNGWLCKLGLCRACAQLKESQVKHASISNGISTPSAVIRKDEKKALSSSEEQQRVAASASAPLCSRVKVIFIVQGGVDLAIKKSASRHQRMPSHEALLQVARQHQLPAPTFISNGLSTATHAPPQSTPTESISPSLDTTVATTLATTNSTTPTPTTTTTLPTPPTPITVASPTTPMTAEKQQEARRKANAIHGENWDSKKSRLQAKSPHGQRPGWDLRCVIVKSGDDCRQELLAMQMISLFHQVFTEANLPLWMRPYEVLVTSNRTALIEMIPNAPSIHSIKAASEPDTSLRSHMIALFGGESTMAFREGQRNFVESMAAYSLLTYLLQIKDRHNGNILLDDAGHVIHIDFGFMLSNSPGGVNFESAPFKLTRELLEVMDSDSEGRPSELFDYYKVLLIQGFLAARKHADRIMLLVEMMSASGCPCFKNKVAAVQGVKKRFALGIPEPAVVENVLGLVSDSLDAWRTRQYDYYQRVLNGIL